MAENDLKMSGEGQEKSGKGGGTKKKQPEEHSDQHHDWLEEAQSVERLWNNFRKLVLDMKL